MHQPISKGLQKYQNLESVLFWLMMAIGVAPIWWLSQIPTQDGPAHLYNAHLLSGWWKTSFPIDRVFFALNHTPVPNWLSTALLAILMQLFSPQLAERLLLTSYVVLLPLSFRYASQSFDYVSRYTYFLGFALVWNYFFQLGFFNFCLSLVWYLFFLGYWARNRHSLGLWNVVHLFLLSVLLYFSNGLSYYLAGATVGVLSLVALATAPRGQSHKRQWYAVLLPQVGLLLSLPLSILFFAQHGKHYATRPSPVSFRSLIWSVTRLPILLTSLNSIDLKLSALFGILLALGAGLAVYSRRDRPQKLMWSDALLLAGACLFVFYIVAPEHTGGGGFINDRIFLFALATVALWVSMQQYDRTTAALLTAAAMISILGLQVRTFERNARLSAMLDQYSTAANHIEEHKLLWALNLDPAGTGYVQAREPGLREDPFEHAGAILALQRNLVDLNNYEAASKNFPIVYNDAFDPFHIIEILPRDGGAPTFPRRVNLAKYDQLTGRAVDYVLLWHLPDPTHANLAVQDLQRQLSSDYVLIYCAENIPLRLYHLRREESSTSGAASCPALAAAP